MRLWIVGEATGQPDAWTFCGVYDSEEKAVAQCVNALRFVGPADLNDTAMDQPDNVTWPGAYYPAGQQGAK